MTKRVLVVDGESLAQLSLSTDTGAVTLSPAPGQAGLLLRGLRITRIRCEVEADDLVVLREPAGEAGADRRLVPGEDVALGPLHLRLEPAAEATPSAPAVAVIEPPVAAADVGLRRKLQVVDGADKGQSFPLPAAGTVAVGNNARAAAVVLHDLYVSPVHCRLDVQADRVVVTPVDGSKSPTRINGQPLAGPQELGLGDTLRVGNSHLRLDLAGPDEPAPAGEIWPEEVQHSRVVQAQEVRPAPAPAAPPPAWPTREKQLVGHYRLGPQLGRGHAGVIHRAEDVNTHAVVALKILPPEFPATLEELRQFARTLKETPQLQHPHLVALHGAGKAGPLCWIAREYVEGECAEQHIERLRAGGKASWTRACRVAIHLARALAFLHRRKLVHGNVTPRNVLIRSEDKQTKLADLMLMNALAGSQLQQAYLEKKLLTELPYLAPEQTEVGALVDDLADLYALGALTYALLTGRPPFSGSTPEEVLEQVIQAPVKRPSKYQKGIPADFEAAVLKLLSKHQEDRYSTAELLLADLEPLAEANGVSL